MSVTDTALAAEHALGGALHHGCIYAAIMAAAELVKTSRSRAGLSGRALAARAGVAYSTVVRIESGQVDPTTGMLERLLAAADHRLVISADEVVPPELADLSSAWRAASDGEPRPDWTSLRAFIDTLALHPQWQARAIKRSPTAAGSDVMDNLLASIAEKIADDAGLSRPAWTLNVTPLREAWFTPGTPQMRESARASAPPQFAARNIWVSAESLWRGGELIEM